MGYRHATFTGHSYKLASDSGETDHELRVNFGGEVGFEMHPFGSTVARENITMIEDVTEIVIDGSVVSETDLIEQFDKDSVEAAIADARDNARED